MAARMLLHGVATPPLPPPPYHRGSGGGDGNGNDDDDGSRYHRIDATGTKTSHLPFFRRRDWAAAEAFWGRLVRLPPSSPSLLPPFVVGSSSSNEYGFTDLGALHAAGLRGEFRSVDSRYTKRQTFAVRVGYDGTCYQGYQSQAGKNGTKTVEDDLKVALGGKICYGAGRTDSGVSALSQIVGFHTTNMSMTGEAVLSRMRSSEPVTSGRLNAYECLRVPKKFNARSSATWRRYLYLFPLNRGLYDGVDVDVPFVDQVLARIEGRELPFNGLAVGDDRNVGEGLQDKCTLYRARAFVVDIGRSPTDTDTDSVTGGEAVQTCGDEPTGRAMCVELVGSRFLRQMVRIIVATTARESVRPPDERRVSILEDICLSRDRTQASVSVPGEALCFCGVGYDAQDLAIFKFMKKAQMEAILAERDALPTTHRSTQGDDGE